ncbi:MAG: VCBS repeat-containing protein [Ruminiclostridium sp.]|nr:VCBS repeat-containing protein [Ruminiclostridium sp.]
MGNFPRAEKYRPNFASGSSVIADVNNDGVNEVIVTGNVYDCEDEYISKYIGPFIFNGDRSRFKDSRYNWESAPKDSGLPLEEDYSVIEHIQPNPKVIDLDGDGEKEILYSSYDGRIHCYWLDKQEHHNWPYEVSDPEKSYIEFSSVPEMVDIDQDGLMEIVVSTWTNKQSGINGRVLLFDHKGNLLAQIELPDSFHKGQGNGALACPLVEGIDNDGLYEVVVNSVNSGFIAYDIEQN